MKNKFALLFIAFCITAEILPAQTPDSLSGQAAFLFAYYPKAGQEAQFEEGYKKHLSWHQKNNDPFVWYGWNVISGDRIGMFVDGTFGISFNAFDNRIKPAEDAAHFKKSTAPFANAVYRKVFKLQPELSSATQLEQWNPSHYIEAITFLLEPGKEAVFEGILSQIVSALRTDGSNQKFTTYRQVTGGKLPAFFLINHHNGFGAFYSDKNITTLSHLIHRIFDKPKAQELSKQLSECIHNIQSETWLYRRDLSYFPSND